MITHEPKELTAVSFMLLRFAETYAPPYTPQPCRLQMAIYLETALVCGVLFALAPQVFGGEVQSARPSPVLVQTLPAPARYNPHAAVGQRIDAGHDDAAAVQAKPVKRPGRGKGRAARAAEVAPTFRWPASLSRLTFSFVPDGRPIFGKASALSRIDPVQPDWKAQIRQAASQWSEVSGFPLVEVAPPAEGDIRIGGYDFPASDSYVLAFASLAPVPGQGIGPDHGDVCLNTRVVANYEVGTVTLHELGHSLGLAHSPDQSDVMFAAYLGPRDLSAGDVQAIRALYPEKHAAPDPAPTPAPPTTGPIATGPLLDFDGDTQADAWAFDPASAGWLVIGSKLGPARQRFGSGHWRPVPADYDGDGLADLGMVDPKSLVWYLLRSRDGAVKQQFGGPGDVPIPADYDGDEAIDLGVYRPSDNSVYWFSPHSGHSGVKRLN